MKTSRRWALVIVAIFVVMIGALSTLTVFAEDGIHERVIPTSGSDSAR